MLDEQCVPDKTNETTTASTLLARQELAGTVVTVNALLTQQPATARTIRDRHGHNLMVVKANQPALHDAITAGLPARALSLLGGRRSRDSRRGCGPLCWHAGRSRGRLCRTLADGAMVAGDVVNWYGTVEILCNDAASRWSMALRCCASVVHFGFRALREI